MRAGTRTKAKTHRHRGVRAHRARAPTRPSTRAGLRLGGSARAARARAAPGPCLERAMISLPLTLIPPLFSSHPTPSQPLPCACTLSRVHTARAPARPPRVRPEGRIDARAPPPAHGPSHLAGRRVAARLPGGRGAPGQGGGWLPSPVSARVSGGGGGGGALRRATRGLGTRGDVASQRPSSGRRVESSSKR